MSRVLLSRLLSLPDMYRVFQESLGFANSRKLAFENWLPIVGHSRIFDIGCGPGNILPYLPENAEYVGFDTSASYIARARRLYSNRGLFVEGGFDERSVVDFHDADIVMLNGVLHHMDDDVAIACLLASYAALKPGGRLFTLDGCYTESQGYVARMLLKLDRGDFVRDREGYEKLLESAFSQREVHVTEELSKIPYTFIVTVCSKETP